MYYTLIIILIICSIFDAKTFKIPNFIVFPLMIFGIIYSYYNFGVEGLIDSTKSIVIIFLILLLPWLINVMGAGDIKLFIALSSFIGWYKVLELVLLSMIIISVIYIFIMGIKRAKELFVEFFYLIFYKIPLLSEGKKNKIQFSVPILFAFILIQGNFVELF